MRQATILGVLCALALLPGLGRPGMDRMQELRVALTARYMADGGNWLAPRFRGEPRLEKPPLMYWLTATGFRLFGTTQSAAVARLPSAAAGFILILTVYLGGARLLKDRNRAWYAALIAVSSMLFIRHARLAETDILQAALLSLALLSAFMALQGDKPARWWAAAGLFAGLGFLTKGPASLIIPLTTIPLYLWTSPSTSRTPNAWRGLWLAPLLVLAIALPWYLYITSADVLEEAAEAAVASEIAALLSSGAHPGPIYYYVIRLPALMMPWGLLLPFALWSAARFGRSNDGLRFALCWLGATFVLLSVLHNKQGHYATLILVPSALVLGWYAMELLHHTPQRQSRIAAGIRALLTVLVLGGLAALFYAASAETFHIIAWISASALLGVAALTLFAHREMMIRQGVILVSIAMICLTGIYIGGFPAFEPGDQTLPRLVSRTKPLLAQVRRLHAVGPESATVEFYFGRSLHEYANVDAAFHAAQPGDGIILTSTKKRPIDLARAPGSPDWIEMDGDVTCMLYLIRDPLGSAID